MLTAWGKKIAACAKYITSNLPFYCLPPVNLVGTAAAFIEAKNTAGTTVYLNPTYQTAPAWSPIVTALSTATSGASYGVAFGSSSTAATENDYTLGSQVTGITATIPTPVTFIDSANYKYVARLDYVVSNDTGATVTIAEIGLFVRFGSAMTRGANASTSGSARQCIMMDRTVLDTPVVIPNGSAATIRYEFAYEG